MEDVKTNTDAKIVHDHHLTGVKKTLRWELNLWIQKPTDGALSAIKKSHVKPCSEIMKAFESMSLSDATLGGGIDDVAFSPWEISYLESVMSTNEEVEKIAGEKQPTNEEVEKIDGDKQSTNEEVEKIVGEKQPTNEEVEKTATEGDEESAIEAKENKFTYLSNFFPKTTIRKIMGAAHEQLEVENKILDSLLWEAEAWKAHPLKGPLALCDDDVVASASALDRPTKEELFTELEDDLNWTKEYISKSAMKLSKMEKTFAMLREY